MGPKQQNSSNMKQQYLSKKKQLQNESTTKKQMSENKNNAANTTGQKKKGLRKDEESLLRMNFLYEAAQMYKESEQLSSYFIRQLIQVSEKKMVRIDKKIRKRICKKCNQFLSVEEILVKEARRLKQLGGKQKLIEEKQAVLVTPQKVTKEIGNEPMEVENSNI